MSLLSLRTKKEDHAADLYRQYGPAIYARCRRILNDPAAAEDAAQETFVRVLRHLESAPSEQEALRWIYRIATNYCLNEVRNRKRRPIPVGETGDFAETNVRSDSAAAGDLQRLLDLAPGNVRVAAWLCHVEERDHGEVAETLGVSRRTVTNYLAVFARRGRKFLAPSAA